MKITKRINSYISDTTTQAEIAEWLYRNMQIPKKHFLETVREARRNGDLWTTVYSRDCSHTEVTICLEKRGMWIGFRI